MSLGRPVGWPTMLSVCLVTLAVSPEWSKAQTGVFVEPAFANLQFRRPIDLQHAGDGTDRLFVAEQSGRIVVFQNDPDVESSEVFLDIEDRVNDSGNEQGLLGLAFPPDFAQRGEFYVSYTASGSRCLVNGAAGCSKVSRFSVTGSDPNQADPNSETSIIEIPQPYSNHNGGQIRFGPDSLLYLGLGDGGSGGDPLGNGQNGRSLLGSLLRIDIRTELADGYDIPPDNPFLATAFRDEIFAYGFRNPWRFSFDSDTGELWLADVGQSSYEEIDLVVKGGNYGWNRMEGPACYSPSTGCNPSGELELPVWSYGRGDGRSITGGFVYRGDSVEELAGTYVYADFVSGRLWGLARDGQSGFTNRLLLTTGLPISAFGVDQDDELYICSFDGVIYAIRSTNSSGSNNEKPAQSELLGVYPNPATSGATVRFALPRAGFISLELFDVAGGRVGTLASGYLAAGEHHQSFLADDLPAGIYLYRLATSIDTKTGKIVVF